MKSAKILPLNNPEEFPIYKDPGYTGAITFGTDHRVAYPSLIKGLQLFSSEGLKPRTLLNRTQFYCIVLCISGESKRTIGLTEYDVYPNTIHFLFPGQVNQNPNIDNSLLTYNIAFSPDFFLNALKQPVPLNSFPFFTYDGIASFELEPSEALHIKEMMLKINESYTSDYRFRENIIRNYIEVILYTALKQYENILSNSTSSANPSILLVNKFKSLVCQHHISKHKPKDYAELLHVTPNHLNETVKSITGKTCTELIQEMILMEAKILLKQTDMPVNEIYDYLHFEDQGYFSRFFKTQTGLSPTEFRKQE
jgi:AraC family transcriptional regulator, transcriptional activator of pobA